MLLEGKKGLILSVTNKNSIGWAVAEMAVQMGAEVGIGAQNEDTLRRVEKLIEDQPKMKAFVCDFSSDEELEKLVKDVEETYGKIDFLVHSAAFANKNELDGQYMNTSRDGFHLAMDISCYSLVVLCRMLEPLMNDDASVVTMSYLGSTRAVGNYNVMGVAKAALEASVRYLACDMGGRGIRVNTVSPGPINTISARGVKGLMGMIDYVYDRAPLKREYGQVETAKTTMYLLSDLSHGVSGQIIFVDSGYNIVGL